MDRHDLIIDHEQAACMSKVKLHKVNGKSSVFPNEDDTNTKGKPKLGEAVRSEVTDFSHMVMVSYAFDGTGEDTESLTTATKATVFDINPLPSVLKGKELESFRREPNVFTFPAKDFVHLRVKPGQLVNDNLERGRPVHRNGPSQRVESLPPYRHLRAAEVTHGSLTENLAESNIPVIPVVTELLPRDADPATLRLPAVDARLLDYEPVKPRDEFLVDVVEFVQDGQVLEKRVFNKRPIPRSSSLPGYRDNKADKVKLQSLTKTLSQFVFEHTGYAQPTGRTPDDDEMIGEFYKFVRNRPFFLNGKPITVKKAAVFSSWLRHHNHWPVSSKYVTKLLMTGYKLVPAGLIPVTAFKDMTEAVNDQEQDLPKLKKKKEKDDKTSVTDEEQYELEKQAQAEAAVKYKRVAPPKQNTMPALKSAKFEQKDNDTVRFTIFHDPNVKSYARVMHRINYQDDKRPDEQPHHRIDVELTHRNTSSSRKTYKPTHRITNVTDPAWMSALEKMFPQAAKEKDYFKNLYASLKISEHDLFLVSFRINKPCTGNLYTHNEDVPALYKDLRVALKKSPWIFILVRGLGVPRQIQALVDEMRSLTSSDPLNVFFKDPNQPYLNHKGVKDNKEIDMFVARARYFFEDFDEYARPVAIGALMEQRAFMGEHKYQCNAAVLPVAGTFNTEAKCYSAYHLQVQVKYEYNDPQLVPGDAVLVDFNRTQNSASITWRGDVTEPSDGTPMGMINVAVRRPWKDDAYLDAKSYNVFGEKDIILTKGPELRAWVQNNCNVPIVLTTNNDEKECKRIMNNVARIKVPKKLREQYPQKAAILDEFRNFLLCLDHTNFSATSLFENIDPEQMETARQIITSVLKPHQLSQLNKWENKGVYCRTVMLTGPSGSGKSFLAYAMTLPWLLNVRVDDAAVSIAEHEALVEFSSRPKKTQPTTDGAQTTTDGAQSTTGDAQPTTDDAQPTTDDAQPTTDDAQPTTDDAQSTPDIPPPPPHVPTESSFSMERGRITTCAMQNDTVDEQYRHMVAASREFAKRMKMEPPLVLRLHGKDPEINAVVTMVRPSYNPTVASMPSEVYNPDVTGELNESLLESYLRFYRRQGGIRDRRMKEVRGSGARYILQLARLPNFPQSAELRATFTIDELDKLAEDLSPIRDARVDLRGNNDTLDREITQKIKKAAKLGLEALLKNAAIVCTTTSVATLSSFNLVRRSHAVILEEAGRANDAECMGLFSHFWNADIRIFVGSVEQLKPGVFGPEVENPFQKQMTLSTIARFANTGFGVGRLDVTARFRNPDLLGVCGLVNNMPELREIDGSYDPTLTKAYAKANENIWQIRTPLLFVNTEFVDTRKDANSSSFCLETAAVTIKDAVARLTYIEGKDHAIITPYKAQVMVLNRTREHAVMLAKSRGQIDLAAQLADIDILTVDAFMGKDRNSVTLDTAATVGHLFMYDRCVVALTRARVSMQIVGPTVIFTTGSHRILNESHPFVKMIRQMDSTKHIRLVDRSELEKLEEYNNTLEAIGLTLHNGEVKPTKSNETAIVADEVRKEPKCGPEELELIKLMKRNNPILSQTNTGDKTWGVSSGNASGWDEASESGEAAGDWEKASGNGDTAAWGDASGSGDAPTWGDASGTGDAPASDKASESGNAPTWAAWGDIPKTTELQNDTETPLQDTSRHSDAGSEQSSGDDWADFPRNSPYKDHDGEERLNKCIVASLEEQRQFINFIVESPVYTYATEDRRQDIERIVGEHNIAADIADEVLNARLNFDTASEHVTVIRLALLDQRDIARPYDEYRELLRNHQSFADAVSAMNMSNEAPANDKSAPTPTSVDDTSDDKDFVDAVEDTAEHGDRASDDDSDEDDEDDDGAGDNWDLYCG
jgi:hypothetical protein